MDFINFIRYTFRFPLLSSIMIAGLLATSVAQAAGGISNTKVTVLSTDTVGSGHFEFEPSFRVLYPVDGSARSALTSYRFTTGLAESIEVGLTFGSSTQVSDIDYGIKFRFWGDETLSAALQGGLTQRSSGTGEAYGWNLGGIVSIKGGDFALDADYSYDHASQVGSANLGTGLKLNPNLQAIAELNYDGQQTRMTFPGFTWQVKDNILLIWGLGTSIAYRQDNVINTAFTFSL